MLNYLKEVITGTEALKKPVFLKDESEATKQIEELKALEEKSSGKKKEKIQEDIKILSYGLKGEEAILFELKNSFMPMIVLHDLFLEVDGLTAQIDYLIITKKLTIILECKNLIGNIEVNSNGEFIRTFNINGRYIKEGIYSPITQNQRHMQVLKQLRLNSKNNIISKKLFQKQFDNNYKSVVVLANPKTVTNMKYAKKDIKEKIIRCDQVNDYIKKLNQLSPNPNMSDKEMRELAEFYLSHHKENKKDYTEKYSIYEDQGSEELENKSVNDENFVSKYNIEDTDFYKELKQYRYMKSKEEGLKPYMIYKNEQIEDIIKYKPRSIEQLKLIRGFGDIKCEKYGRDIIKIVEKYK
ncbi:NERD domain-containing protein [Clostridium bornimense]|uniref:NERD domain-containing protein n=1 Tax=Clostridium bornimense TaxID=1216932 RepID=UPI001C104619|nr:NERD domain-containing protein [Clostridium bornimense]MBU5316524.1 NERD domain-containing protein [Clostridium bornimense]